ncbi:MAG: biotin transporter BioY [Acidobacteriota bacterium]
MIAKRSMLVPARPSELLRPIGLPVLFALLVGLAGQVRVPIPGNPVPFTLQVVFVLLAGAFLRPVAAIASMTLFVTIGLGGLPVFSGHGAGLAYLLGPTGGYLLGFIAGAGLCSFLLNGRRDSLVRTVLAMTAGLAAVYALGAVHLALHLGGDLSVALRVGVLPFLPAAGAKLVIAAAFSTGTAGLFPRTSGRGHDGADS